MFALSSVPIRRSLIANAVAAAFSLILLATPCYVHSAETVNVAALSDVEDKGIYPFRINIPEDALADLRQRVLATRWPEMETVNDDSQGVRLEKIKALVEYWGTEYD